MADDKNIDDGENLENNSEQEAPESQAEKDAAKHIEDVEKITSDELKDDIEQAKIDAEAQDLSNKLDGKEEPAAESEKEEKKGLTFNSKAGIATSAGGLVLLTVAYNRAKALFSGNEPTEEQIEAGEEPAPKSFFSKVANGVTAIVAAVGAVSLAMDIKNGNSVGDTGKSWADKVTFGKTNFSGLER